MDVHDWIEQSAMKIESDEYESNMSVHEWIKLSVLKYGPDEYTWVDGAVCAERWAGYRERQGYTIKRLRLQGLSA